MQIIDNRKSPSVDFETIKEGEIFYDAFDSETFCLKTQSFREGNDICNAVCLVDGQFYCFRGDDQVQAVRAVLQIYNK